MRLLFVLGVFCLLNSGALGAHGYSDYILRLHREAEDSIMPLALD